MCYIEILDESQKLQISMIQIRCKRLFVTLSVFHIEFQKYWEVYVIDDVTSQTVKGLCFTCTYIAMDTYWCYWPEMCFKQIIPDYFYPNVIYINIVIPDISM